MRDRILIDSLEIEAHIGVPDEERATRQRLTASIELETSVDFEGLEDRIERTVDYVAVCSAVRKIAAERPRKLLETMAEDIALGLLARFSLERVEIELRKFVVPGTAFTGVRIRRPR